MSIANQVALVKKTIADAAIAAGRNPSDIFLVAATKMNDADRVREAIAAGVDICGENRVQELLDKQEAGAYEGAPLHFIGVLQKNKVKYLVGLVSLIHSVDSLDLLSVIDRTAARKELVQDVLLEVNIGGEESKSGFRAEELSSVLASLSSFPNIRVRGLMAIPPASQNAEETRPYFQQMHQLFIDNSAKKYDNVSMDFLSMGMSNDYPVAIACGANMVRVGSQIFGARVYPEKAH